MARVSRPAIVTVTAAIVGIPAGLAVFTGGYLLTRKAFGDPVPALGGTESSFVAMVLLSILVSIVLILGLGAMWERRYGGRRTVMLSAMFGLSASTWAQLAFGTEFIAIGVSWIATGVSGVLLIIAFLPQVRAYFSEVPAERQAD